LSKKIGRSSLAWYKSSYSAHETGCVEVAITTDRVAVRDSKNPEGPIIQLTHGQYEAFIREAKAAD
jgi:hypothetical protein